MKKDGAAMLELDGVHAVYGKKIRALKGVSLHVHPGEVEAFIENLMTIIGSSGQAIVMSRWSDHDTFQANKWMWAHSIAGLSDLVRSQGGTLAVLAEKPGIGKGMRSGTFKIVREANVTSG